VLDRQAGVVTPALDAMGGLTEDEEDTSPWSTEPLTGQASWPFVYFPMRYSMGEEL
jgi:hypothetical protein